MKDNENKCILYELISHVNLALSTLKHRQYFIVVYTGDGKLSFQSSKTSLNKTFENIDDYTATALYLECLSKKVFTVHRFPCSPKRAYHLIYKRP